MFIEYLYAEISAQWKGNGIYNIYQNTVSFLYIGKFTSLQKRSRLKKHQFKKKSFILNNLFSVNKLSKKNNAIEFNFKDVYLYLDFWICLSENRKRMAATIRFMSNSLMTVVIRSHKMKLSFKKIIVSIVSSILTRATWELIIVLLKK